MIYLCFGKLHSQLIFEQGIVNGGLTVAGFSTGQGVGSGAFDIYIEPGSTVEKAYAFSYRIGFPPPLVFDVNGTSVIFDTTKITMDVSSTIFNANPTRLFYKDVTNLITSTTTSFNVIIPQQNGLPINVGYWTYFIVVIYENSSLQNTTYSIIINEQDFIGNQIYSISSLNAIDTNFPVGFSVYADRITSFPVDQEIVFVEGNLIGGLSGPDNVNNLWDAGGVKGHFYYQNNQLFGLDDDTPDAVMGGGDGLADISSYISSSTTSLNFSSQHTNYPNQPDGATNINLAYFLAYTSPCDTFSVSTPNDTIVCHGDQLQLNVTGGQSYEWLPATGLSCNTCPNPIFTADSSMFYTVRIWNNDSCSVVRPLKINVHPELEWGTVPTTPSECGTNTGTVTLNAIPNNGIVDSWTEVGGVTQTNNIFQNLSAGNHTFFFTDTNGCNSADTTILVGTVNSIIASFSVSPQSGAVPLTVSITNSSQNATNYEWFLDGVSQGSSFTSTAFGVSGNYEIMLVAWNNNLLCADTAWQTVIVYDSLIVTIPNVFTPNHDGVNDFFELTTNLPLHCELVILNRWGNIMYEFNDGLAVGSTKLWNGFSTLYNGDLIEGTYFYHITFTSLDNSTLELEKAGILPLIKDGFVDIRR